MMKQMCAAIAFMFCATMAMAQAGPQEEPNKPLHYHQIFLQQPIDSVKNVYYPSDSTPIQFQLSPDKMAIYLLDYDGVQSVKVEYYQSGMPADLTKSKCNVHALEHL